MEMGARFRKSTDWWGEEGESAKRELAQLVDVVGKY